MTQDEIIEMVREAGGSDVGGLGWTTWVGTQSTEFLEAFANLVAAKATEEANAKANASWTLMCKKMVAIEREACAKVVDEVLPFGLELRLQKATIEDCAAAIRARGQA